MDLINWSRRSSLLIPSASALKFGIILCLKTGFITEITSSNSGVGLFDNTALAFAASIRYILALGPAPQLIYFFVQTGEESLIGRVLFTKLAT